MLIWIAPGTQVPGVDPGSLAGAERKSARLANSLSCRPDGADVVGPSDRADAHDRTGERCLDHQPAADVDAHVVDGAGVGQVGGEEDQVAGSELVGPDVLAGLPLVG